MKLVIGTDAYNEIVRRATEQGIQINTGATSLTLEKSIALTDDINYRFVAIRQNCLMSAAQAYAPSRNASGDAIHDANKFLNFCDEIFNWCLNGKGDIDKNPDTAVTKGWK